MRYEYFAREGSGIVALGFEDTNKVPIKIFDSNEINLGGFVSLTPKNTEDKRFKLQFLHYTNDKRNSFTSSSISWDSGMEFMFMIRWIKMVFSGCGKYE
ncbi:hypothetical protein E3N37_04680 [Campylobacter jejuni]|nr:hypothetical protein [Campylobacter jejuni]EAI5280870.1 hypothetical protein [Campylobacter jejuni]EAI8398896.1 hypothetical protein [Campylobacter jejuni]EAK1096542.1 hypothetical protein [Campylobacter jejuni]EAW7250017.1 hypothetical protein [Campylobacter jejuni]